MTKLSNENHQDASGVEVYHPSENYSQSAEISNLEQYQSLYETSIDEPEFFWRNIAINEFCWKNPPSESEFLSYNFDRNKGPIYVEWMRGALTNISYNCLDKNISELNGDRVAYIWEGNSPDEQCQITYQELKTKVCKAANVLKSLGVTFGSNVAIYMPVTIELVVAMLACARLGAIHTVIFAGFSAEALADRIKDGKCSVLITTDGVYRGTKLIKLKDIADSAINKCLQGGFRVNNQLVHSRLGLIKRSITAKKEGALELDEGNSVWWNEQVDVDWSQAMSEASEECQVVWVDATHPLFTLYSSGSTGKPKGIVQSTGGYMVYSGTVFKHVFNYHKDDIMFCTADLGWITGHTMSVYGALCNGATCILYEGTPFHPDPSRFWKMVDRYQVTILYSAPTVVRSLMKYDNSYVTQSKRTSLKLLGLVGEPVNPDAWRWFYEVVGDSRCPIVDTYFQTETAAPILTPLPGATPLKPGSATRPFFGIEPAILDDDGNEIEEPNKAGHLVLKGPWPGMLLGINGDQERFEATYFSKFSKPFYVTGDRAKRDHDGYYWVLGRADDMLNVSGHLLSTAEVESALAGHRSVAEAAVVSFPHNIKGEALSCYVVMKNKIIYDDVIECDLKSLIRTKIGPLAVPDRITCMKQLPKTRSGKIMRRILKKASCDDYDLGDISTMADQTALGELFPIPVLKSITAN